MEEGKTEEPGERPSEHRREPTLSKLNSHVAPGHTGEKRALSPLRHPCSFNQNMKDKANLLSNLPKLSRRKKQHGA